MRAKVQRINGVIELRNVWHFYRCMRSPLSFHGHIASTTHLDQAGRQLSTISSDLRLTQLRYLIKNWVSLERSLKATQVVVRVSKRVHLVELVSKFMEEREARKSMTKRKRGGPSPNERFTDLLFPETIGYKQAHKPKTRRANSNEKGDNPRERAKRTFEYWIRLGLPLMRMAQRFGIGILLLLPEDLTDAE
jgi:hypothetical protein